MIVTIPNSYPIYYHNNINKFIATSEENIKKYKEDFIKSHIDDAYTYYNKRSFFGLGKPRKKITKEHIDISHISSYLYSTQLISPVMYKYISDTCHMDRQLRRAKEVKKLLNSNVEFTIPSDEFLLFLNN